MEEERKLNKYYVSFEQTLYWHGHVLAYDLEDADKEAEKLCKCKHALENLLHVKSKVNCTFIQKDEEGVILDKVNNTLTLEGI